MGLWAMSPAVASSTSGVAVAEETAPRTPVAAQVHPGWRSVTEAPGRRRRSATAAAAAASEEGDEASMSHRVLALGRRRARNGGADPRGRDDGVGAAGD